MNVFYETLSGVLEEIRSEGMEREYVILPEDLKEAEAELKTERKKFEALLENLQGKKKEILVWQRKKRSSRSPIWRSILPSGSRTSASRRSWWTIPA